MMFYGIICIYLLIKLWIMKIYIYIYLEKIMRLTANYGHWIIDSVDNPTFISSVANQEGQLKYITFYFKHTFSALHAQAL